MKKHFLFAAAFAALMTCACSVEPMDVVDVQPEEEGEITVLTAGFAGDETRTVRQADGKVFWSPKDEISVIRGSNVYGKKFVSTNTEEAATASFTGTMPSGSGNFWAIHPYNQYSYFNGTYLVTELPQVQEAVEGSFDEDAFMSVAYSRTSNVTFSHVTGGFKFTLAEAGINRVVVSANGGEPLSGVVGINRPGGNPAISAFGDYSSRAEIDAPEGETLTPGVPYHIVTVPRTLSRGFTMTFVNADGEMATRTVSKSAKVIAAHFLSLTEPDAGLSWEKVFEFSPSSATVDPLGGVISITVRSTVDFHIDVASDWIHPYSEEGDPLFGRTFLFKVDQNHGEARDGLLIICNDSTCIPFSVSQGDGSNLKSIIHHSLGMRFTATWCGWCPYMNESFSKAKELLGDRFDYVNLHASDSDLAFSGTTTLANQYEIGGYPTGIIDGRVDISNSTDTDAVAREVADAVDQQEDLYPVQTAVGLESSLNGRDLTVKAQVFARNAGTYKLTVFLLESGVVHYQNGGGNNYVHNRIARMSLTAYAGDTVQVTEDNGTTTVNFTASIPSSYVLDNMSVLAYVQCPFGEQVVIQSGSYGDWYIDNCRSAALGATAPLEVQ